MDQPRNNLNAELGESFGACSIGRDGEMLQSIHTKRLPGTAGYCLCGLAA